MVLIRIKERFCFSFLLTAYLLSLIALFSGCIRLTGTAGFWHKGPQDETAQVKQVTLDTDEIVHPNKAPGSIET